MSMNWDNGFFLSLTVNAFIIEGAFLGITQMLGWRRKWQLTPVFLPGEFHDQRSLEGYSPSGHKESDTAEPLSLDARQ